MAILKTKRFWAAVLALVIIIFLFRDFNFRQALGRVQLADLDRGAELLAEGADERAAVSSSSVC